MSDFNIILKTDSYKYSQYLQYPEGTEYVFSYIESRGGIWGATQMFGLQSFLMQIRDNPVTMEKIDEAEAIVLAHGEPFNREGWEYIVRVHGGHLPVMIKAVREGTVVPVKNALVTIVNTDPKCGWLTSFLETPLLRAVWYGTTVATNSYECKKTIKRFLDLSSDIPDILLPSRLHDFGARGVSSGESAGIGGAAHLVNFQGTDTVEALLHARRYYGADMAGFSIPASEHSTITSWGRENEVDAYRNMLKQFAKPGAIVACVSDSYDIYNACENLWGGVLKDEVVNSEALLVVRPDSGDPLVVPIKCIELLEKKFGSTKNSKGYRVLNNVRVIQGDGVDGNAISNILSKLYIMGYAADNIAFGMGGALNQKGIDRDTQKFAMKCSAICIGGVWRNVYKDPITDEGKRSKKGRLALIKDESGYHTVSLDGNEGRDILEPAYFAGIVREQTFDEIRFLGAREL